MNDKMYAIPTVGSSIRVTTRHQNINYLTSETQPFVEYTYEGRVLAAMKHDQPYTFNMTGSGFVRERNIDINRVIKLEMLDGSAVRTISKALGVRKFKVESKGKVYLVSKIDNKYSCTCVGFQYHRKCKHITGVHQKVG